MTTDVELLVSMACLVNSFKYTAKSKISMFEFRAIDLYGKTINKHGNCWGGN
jgi:hypothetical protein